MLKNPLLSTFFTLVLVKGLNFLIPVLTTPYLTRTLGIANYGLLMTNYTLSQYFIILCDFGIEFYGAREISLCKNKFEEHVLISKIYALKAFLFFITILLFPFFSHSSDIVLNSSFLVLIFGNALLPNWLMLGKNNIKKFSFVLTIGKLTSLSLIFLFLKNNSQNYLYPLFDGVTLILISILFLKDTLKLNLYKINEIIAVAKNSFPLFISKVSISLYTITNPLIVAYYLGSHEVGLFVGLTKIVDIPVSMLNPINQTLFNQSVKKHEYKIDFYYLKKVLIYIPTIFFLSGLILYFLFEKISILYLGKNFIYNSDYKILSFTPFIISFSSILGFQYFLASGKRKEFSYITMAGSILSIILCSLNTKFFGIKGTIVSYMFIESFISIIMLYKFIAEARKTSL